MPAVCLLGGFHRSLWNQNRYPNEADWGGLPSAKTAFEARPYVDGSGTNLSASWRQEMHKQYPNAVSDPVIPQSKLKDLYFGNGEPALKIDLGLKALYLVGRRSEVLQMLWDAQTQPQLIIRPKVWIGAAVQKRFLGPARFAVRIFCNPSAPSNFFSNYQDFLDKDASGGLNVSQEISVHPAAFGSAVSLALDRTYRSE